MTRCRHCGKPVETSSLYCSHACESARYPYNHHGPTVYGNKLTDFLISEHSLREDGLHPDDNVQ